MKNVVLANLASPANPGDQAILRGSLKLLREVLGNSPVTLSTRAYSQRAVYEALGCPVVPSFPDVDRLSMDDSLGKWGRIPAALGGREALREAVRNCDAVFLAGGAYYYSYRKFFPGLTYLAHFSAVYWAGRFGKPVIFLPQSYGPFASPVSRSLFGWALSRARRIYYREEISGDFLRRSFAGQADRMHFMPDLALYLEQSDVVKASLPKIAKSPVVGVTLRPWEAGKRPLTEYMTMLEDLFVRTASVTEARLRIIVQVQDAKSGEGDEAVSLQLEKRLADRLGRDRVELHTARPYYKLEDLCELYADCDLMLAMRLHSALLSFVVGCPAVVVGYQHKAEGILKSLGLDDLYAGNFDQTDPAGLREKFLAVWNDRGGWKQRIRDSLVLARQKIQEGFREGVL